MQPTTITPDVAVDLISHLFDPLLLRSRTATKILVSPTLVLDFPFLPPASSSHDHTTRRIDRHSPSAQALALFRLPSLIVNFLPGCSWTLEVAQVKEYVDEGSESTWVADIDWSLNCHLFLLDRLPLTVGSRFKIENVSHRTLSLTFEPNAADTTTATDTAEKYASMDKESSSPTVETSKDFAQQNLVLSRVVYSGIPEPSILAGIPGYHFISHILRYIMALLLAPAYGLLLLFGLDHSTRSLSSRASSKRRQQRAQDRDRQQTKHGSTRRRRSSPAFDSGSSHESAAQASASDSEDGWESVADPDAIESNYHALMRSGHVVFHRTQRSVESITQGVGSLVSEVVLFGTAVRRVVVVAVESGLSLVGAGLDVIGAGVGSAIEEGGRIGEEVREEEEEQRQRRTETRFGRSGGTPKKYRANSNVSTSSIGSKRVSFSVPTTDSDALLYFSSPSSPPEESTVAAISEFLKPTMAGKERVDAKKSAEEGESRDAPMSFDRLFQDYSVDGTVQHHPSSEEEQSPTQQYTETLRPSPGRAPQIHLGQPVSPRVAEPVLVSSSAMDLDDLPHHSSSSSHEEPINPIAVALADAQLNRASPALVAVPSFPRPSDPVPIPPATRGTSHGPPGGKLYRRGSSSSSNGDRLGASTEMGPTSAPMVHESSGSGDGGGWHSPEWNRSTPPMEVAARTAEWTNTSEAGAKEPESHKEEGMTKSARAKGKRRAPGGRKK